MAKWKLILLLVAHLRPRSCGGKFINSLFSHEERYPLSLLTRSVTHSLLMKSVAKTQDIDILRSTTLVGFKISLIPLSYFKHRNLYHSSILEGLFLTIEHSSRYPERRRVACSSEAIANFMEEAPKPRGDGGSLRGVRQGSASRCP